MIEDLYKDPTPCRECGKWKLTPGQGFIGEFCDCGHKKQINMDLWHGKPQLRCQ